MPLSLIAGPPNSGRASAIVNGFEAAAGQDPVLVVPTRDHVVRFERDLCSERDGAGFSGGLLGGAVTTFAPLFAEVARATGAPSPNPLTSTQRTQLVSRAVAKLDLRALGTSAGSRGFVPAVERLLGELQSAGIEPAAVRSELGGIYAGYRSLCEQLGVADEHDLAAGASTGLRQNPDAWGRRPVFLYGFDDLTPEQLELVRALAEAAEVSVAVSFEDRAALAARSRLFAQLRDDLGGRIVAELPRDSGYTGSAVLSHLDRHLFEPAAPRIAPDDGLELLESAGSRAEAEHIGGRVARLLSDGVAPDDIAIVLRHPDADGPLFGRVLRSLGIQVATEANVPLSRTGVGMALGALLRICLESRSADDVLAFLRSPSRARPDNVDWLERAVLRGRLTSAEQALEEWERRGGSRPWEIGAVTDPDSRVERLLALGRVAASIGERPLRRLAAIPHGPETLELRAAAAARTACAELAALGDLAPELPDALAAIEEIGVRLWTGPVEGRVRIVDPYGVRAGRARHLFVASLQDGDFPAPGAHDSLLGDDEREELGLPARRPPLEEERYLFHACVSRPTDRLYLSARTCDEDGQAAVASPFVEDVRDLLESPPPANGPDPVREHLTSRRGLDAVVFAAGEATNEPQLRRSLAALPAQAAVAWTVEVGLPDAIASPALAAVDSARERGATLPGPLRSPGVIAELAERRLYGASTLEEYVSCPYRWFVGHELRPESLRPRPDPLTQGGIVHKVLERLYTERPGDTALPRAETLDRWTARAAELIEEVARHAGIEADGGVRERVAVARMIALVERFLDRQAQSESPLSPDPALLEASFGTEDADRPALAIGDFELRGLIDRVDVSQGPGRAALVQDYKLGRKVSAGASLAREGKLQLQLYTLAARELWGLEPIGAVYHPLGARGPRESRSRGLLAATERGALLAGVDYVRTDFVEDEDLDGALEDARTRAIEIVAEMRAGTVERRPLDGTCPTYCAFQPICRRERAIAIDPELEEENGT